MSGRVVVDGNASQYCGATAHGGLIVVHGDTSRAAASRSRAARSSCAARSAATRCFMAQAGRARRLRRRRRRARRLALRGAHLRARRGRGARRRLHREGAARRAPRRSSRDLLERAGIARRRRRASSAATARRASSTPSRSTTPGRTDELEGQGEAGWTPPGAGWQPGLRESHLYDRNVDRRDPARRARGHLRHPRLRREAPAPPLRRPAVPRREHVALPARGLPRALRHERHAGRALREEAARAEDPDHDRRHELRRALGARPRRRSAAARARSAPRRPPATAA